MSKPNLEPSAFLEKYRDQSTTFVITRPGSQPKSETGWTLLDGLQRLTADPGPMAITACIHHIPVNPDRDYVSITDADYMDALLELVRGLK
jgi:hypothetical protein